jgi:hypothetical protein
MKIAGLSCITPHAEVPLAFANRIALGHDCVQFDKQGEEHSRFGEVGIFERVKLQLGNFWCSFEISGEMGTRTPAPTAGAARL